MTTTSSFFDYACDACGAPVCERMSLMNLSLGYEEDLYCLNCLAAKEDLPLETLLTTCKQYIQSRDCFKKPWNRFDASACPKLKDHTCLCQENSVEVAYAG